jgi:hypothetical protein
MDVLRQVPPQILYGSYFSRDPVGERRDICSASLICAIVPAIRGDERRFSRGSGRNGENI